MITALTLLAATAHADPCGMVPPAWIPPEQQAQAIRRTGDQETYVFFADGMETIAIRPAFTGTVDEFGMLVPLPSPPAIRKLSDAVFTQLPAAVDAPQLNIRLYRPQPRRYAPGRPSMAPAAKSESAAAPAPERLRFDQVKVHSQEALGMYEVAVLEAGSPKALEKWMKERDYRYPNGMDDVVFDYVADGWVFVAVKAKVGQMPGVTPRPGMRGVQPKLPANASFTGNVQGMAFRFHVDEPVVPMRLSTFNGEDANNRVYFLADRPYQISGRDQGLVKRQVKGSSVRKNVTGLLPMVVTGGTEADIPAQWRPQIQTARDPSRFSAVARELMAADLLALKEGALVLPVEVEEKQLLNINETLGMRGPQVDALVDAAMTAERSEHLADAVAWIDGMVLNVYEGDFGNAWLQENNLEFDAWTMPTARNGRNSWSRAPTAGTMHVPIAGSEDWGGPVPW